MIVSATLVSLFSCQYLTNYGYMSKHVVMCCSAHHLRSRRCVVPSLDTSMTNIDCSKQTSRHGERYIRYRTCIALLQMVAWLFVYLPHCVPQLGGEHEDTLLQPIARLLVDKYLICVVLYSLNVVKLLMGYLGSHLPYVWVLTCLGYAKSLGSSLFYVKHYLVTESWNLTFGHGTIPLLSSLWDLHH